MIGARAVDEAVQTVREVEVVLIVSRDLGAVVDVENICAIRPSGSLIVM